MYRVVGGSLTRTTTIYDRYIAVLESALPASETEEERTVIHERLKWLEARKYLALAHAAAREGRDGDARAAAAEAMDGGGRMAAEAVALRVAPRIAVRLGDRFRGRRVR
jgi:hypothetical protein